MTGIMRALGTCYAHDGAFWFDPEHVNVVLVDPVTGRPPDVGPDPDTPDDEARRARSAWQPVCVQCCDRVNLLAGCAHFNVTEHQREAEAVNGHL